MGNRIEVAAQLVFWYLVATVIFAGVGAIVANLIGDHLPGLARPLLAERLIAYVFLSLGLYGVDIRIVVKEAG